MSVLRLGARTRGRSARPKMDESPAKSIESRPWDSFSYITSVIAATCVPILGSVWLREVVMTRYKMLHLKNADASRCRQWCVLVVLFAVVSLTVSVTTRYGYSHGTSQSTAVQKHSSQDRVRQRLLKNAATWTPPVVCAEVLEAPPFYPRIAPAGPPIPNLLLEKNLYNRPPPFLNRYSS